MRRAGRGSSAGNGPCHRMPHPFMHGRVVVE